jgi:hypothetical protein
MGKAWATLWAGLMVFGAFSSSSSYKLNSYSVGPAGTNSAHSTTYYTQTTGGEVAGNSVTSTHYTGTSGGVQTEQLAVPQAPTVSNGSGAFYTYLNVILNNSAGTNTYPTDVTFSIGVSTTNCFTSTCIQSGAVKFVQTGGTLNTSQFYQSYSAWGGSSGLNVTGLTAATTYYVAVAAKQGTFTNTEYGASATQATATPYITFSVTPNTMTLSNLLPGNITTSGTATFGLATNATYGATVYNSGQFGGLHSASTSNTIPATTGSLSGASHGFGLQGVSTNQTSGGPLSIDSPYNGTGNTVGTESTTITPIFSTSASIIGGSATMNMQVKPSTADPPSSDYSETLTFIAAASF